MPKIGFYALGRERANARALLKHNLVSKNRKFSTLVTPKSNIFSLNGIRTDLKEDFEICAESDPTPVHFKKSDFEKL